MSLFCYKSGVYDAIASFFFDKRGVKSSRKSLFLRKKGVLSKAWNAHGNKVSKVSDTAECSVHYLPSQWGHWGCLGRTCCLNF